MRLIEAATAIAIAGFILAGGSERASACEARQQLKYDEPVELEGVLKQGKGHHDNQGDFSYIYLSLDEGICVTGAPDDEFAVSTPEPVTKVQVAGDAIQTKLPVGKRVKIKGTLFGAHTMWHVEDVLIDASAVQPK